MSQTPRNTRQREVILKTLEKSASPVSAVALGEVAKKRIPSINKATIYRTLERLEKEGLIVQVMVKSSVAHYELAPKEQHNHQHFVCDKCSEVFCVATTHDTRAVSVDVTLPKGFVFREQEIIIRGLCADCSKKKKSATLARRA